MGMTPLMTADSLSLHIGHARLIHDVSLTIERGELLTVIGPNGAGKSTLLRLLGGEAMPSSGEVYIEDRRIADMGAIELARRRAVLPQISPTTFPFTTREVVGFARTPWLRTRHHEEDDEVVQNAMDATDVTKLASHTFPTLSGGEQTLVSLARVLAQRTSLLLLDEPTSALDLRHQALVMDLLRDLVDQGVTVVAALHDLNFAATHATRVLVLQRGQVAACGSPESILEPKLLSAVFEHPVRVVTDPVTGSPIVVPERRTRPGRTDQIVPN